MGVYYKEAIYETCTLNNWHVEKESYFGKPEHKDKTKIFFLGDKSSQTIYDQIEHLYFVKGDNTKWQGVWSTSNDINDEIIAAEIAAADAVLLCVKGGVFFKEVWDKIPKTLEIIRNIQKPVLYLHAVYSPDDKQKVFKDLGECTCLEILEDIPFSDLVLRFNESPNDLLLGLTKQMKKEIDDKIESFASRKISSKNLQKELRTFDLEKPFMAFINTIQQNHQFYLFCVEGSAYSGQDILLDRMKKNMPNPNIPPHRIHFWGNSTDIKDVQSLWTKLRSDFKINSPREAHYSLVDTLLNAPKLLIFDDVITEEMDVETAKEKMDLVAHFWQKICLYLDDAHLDHKHKIYVIAVNRGYTSQKQFSMAGFANNHPQAIVKTLAIEPINLTYAQRWYSKNWDKFMPVENGQIQVPWDEVVGEGHMDRVLMRLCEELGCRAETYTNLINNTNLQQ